MSRRRQRSAAYRARRSLRRQVKTLMRDFGNPFISKTTAQILADIEATKRYFAWYVNQVTPQVATGAFLDELAQLTPVSEEEIRDRYSVMPAHQLDPSVWEPSRAEWLAAQKFYADTDTTMVTPAPLSEEDLKDLD